MSAFSLLISPAGLSVRLLWLTGRSATLLLLDPPGAHHCSSKMNTRWAIDWNVCKSRRFGEWLEPRDIFGAFGLDQWAITLSSKDGCFQAHLLVVFAQKPPFPLSHFLETLAYDLGSFPFDFGPLHPKSVCKRLTKVFGVSLELVRLWATLSHRVLYPFYHSWITNAWLLAINLFLYFYFSKTSTSTSRSRCWSKISIT